LLSGTARDGERPATYREVLSSREFRAVYTASTLSWVGDYLARAAVTALVFQTTHSVVASAGAFAISFAPWLMGGSVLVSIAERHPYRTVMVYCDLARMLLMSAVAVPGLPLPFILVLLLLSALFSPPFDAARSATLPAILPGDRYVVGLGLHTATSQPAQVFGYFVGASIAAVEPRLALLVNAATFGLSALLVRLGVKLRKPGLDQAHRSDLLRETVDGFRLVFMTPALRAVVLLVFCGSLFAVVPEGLAAAWAALANHGADRGWAQGIIMAAAPLGSILGAVSISRLASPARRARLLRPLAVATPLALVPTLFDPPAVVVALLAGACGFAIGGLVPVANGQFVQALPNKYRARAFGVVQGGLQLLQGTAVLATGWLAYVLPLPVVVGLWSLVGVGMMILLSLAWPPAPVFAEAIAAARAANAGGAVASDHAATPRPASGVPPGDDPGPVPRPAPAAADDPVPASRRASATVTDPGYSPTHRSSEAATGTTHRGAPAPIPGTMEP
jgi:hypothetical protein